MTFVPKRLPDQTLYSWVAMFHMLSGAPREAGTCRTLFGSPMAGRHFHIPSHLDHFCEQTQFAFGTVEDVVAEMTIIPFFTQFRSRHIVDDVVNKIRSSSASGVAQTLGFAKGGRHNWPPHKACTECVKEDAQEYGYSYWHLAHQWPCTLVCHKHGTMLVGAMDAHQQTRRLPFVAPQVPAAINVLESKQWIGVNEHGQLDRLAQIARSIGTHRQPLGWETERIRLAFVAELRRLGIWHEIRLMDPHKLEQEFRTHFSDLMEVVELAPSIRDRGLYTVWCIAAGIQRTVHAEDWVIAIEWLFGSWIVAASRKLTI